MNKDKALEELFLAQKPHFDDNDAFMASLTKRLDAVEYIKQYQEATLRRSKMALVVAFVAGIIGVANAKKPEKAGTCMGWGIVVAALCVAGSILTVVGGSSFPVFSLILGLVLPVLFIIGAAKNKQA